MSTAKSYGVSKVCRVLNISRSTFYYHKKHLKSKKTFPYENLILSVFHKNLSTYGRRRIQRSLEKQGKHVSQYIIAKVLKKHDLEAKHGRKKYAHNIYTSDAIVETNPKNLIKDAPPTAKIYAADMSEFRCKDGKLIVSGIIDQKTRVIVGYCIGTDYKADILRKMFEQAFTTYGVPDFVHTDNGSQFRGRQVHDYIVESGAKHSFSKPRSPWHNQYIESFWKTMKVEIGRIDNMSIKDLKIVIEYYIYYYNNKRLHSSIGYKTPMQMVNTL